MTSFFSHSEEETISIGKQFAASLKGNEVIGLSGDLGAGKTQFTKGLCNFFGLNESEISSPTFSIVNEYPGSIPIFHFDFYRIENEKELWDIGIEDYFSLAGIKIIEWYELAPNVLPENMIKVKIEINEDDSRLITITRQD